MLIVGTDEAAVEADLVGGRLECPTCEIGLRPWGHGIEREVRHRERTERRRLRRSICKPCATTHVLVPEDTLVRRRDSTEVIGAALDGQGQRDGPPPDRKGPRPSTLDGAQLAAVLRDQGHSPARALRPLGPRARPRTRPALGWRLGLL